MSFGIVIVNALRQWTDTNMSAVQSICFIALLFITAIQLNKHAAQPKLIRLVCLLYCNQQIRRIYTNETATAIDLFPNILLATMLAVFLIAVTEKNNNEALDDMRTMLEALLYMYGDILDFLFQYGILPLTLAAFAAGLVFQTIPPPHDPIQRFFFRMAGIISTNLLYEGATSLVQSSGQIELIESVAAAVVIRKIVPSMESYLTYLTAMQLTYLVPGIAPIMFCVIIWINVFPKSSRGWISELCATYIILATMNYLATAPTWGASTILVFAHYIDYVIAHLD